ncbi:MAG: hypothetical protein ACRBCJ_04680 [Hyphomicrobiaceae bacterium]
MEYNKNTFPKPQAKASRSQLARLIFYAFLSISMVFTAAHAEETANKNSDNPSWPCVQRKVMDLSANTMWDGPTIEGIDDYYRDAKNRKLIPFLIRRRNEMEAAEKAIEDFAKSLPEDKRDRALTVLFAGVFDTLNRKRRSVIRGIERYQERQEARAAKLQGDSTTLSELRRNAGTSDEANKTAQLAQEKYDWDARVFQERQENIPFACEIPVNIAQRAYGLAQAIRAQMIN